MDTSKMQPHDFNAETAVLGGILINPSVDAYNLNPEVFYRPENQIIYKAIQQCKTVGETIDIVTVSNRLNGDVPVKYLGKLVESVATSAGIQSHINIIKKHAQLRQLINSCSDIAEQAFSKNTNPTELISTLTQQIRNIQIDDSQYVEGVDISNVYDASRMLDEYKSYVKELKRNRFITGIPEIDKRIRGVGGGEVLTILARSGSFKTATLQNFLKNYIDHSQWGSVMFSLEMPVAGIAERYNEIIHGASGRDIEEIYYNDDTNYIREPLEKQFKESLKNLFIVPTKVSANDIIRYIPLIEHHYKLKIGVIGIDYLGLMDGPGKSTYEIISNIAKDVKVKIAKRLNLPVVLLAQVSRNQGGSGTQELYLESGRDSGAIEESADFILGFWQQEKEAEDAEEQSFDLICKILKNRKGPKNSCWKLDINEVNLRLGSTATRYILNDKNDKKDKQNGF